MSVKKEMDIIACTASLTIAIQEAGGRISTEMLDMTVREFIANVAAQNGIRFIHKKRSGLCDITLSNPYDSSKPFHTTCLDPNVPNK